MEKNDPIESKLCQNTNQVMNLDFHNLSYTVRNKSLTGKKKILDNLNGSFQSNKLTAILGASGSGKTTLLSILAGILFEGSSGKICFNGKSRNMNLFKKSSCYITQEDYLRPFLTLWECMAFAANLKLDPKTKIEHKHIIIQEILTTLGLIECKNVRTNLLSGGQKKRSSLALELINDPPVIFLDEPTTGLDCVSATKCIDVLKKLSKQGRLIVCSIHQPSKHIFDKFNQVYFLVKGQCIYDGSPSDIVKHLTSLNLVCPLSWNVADYLLEISSDEITFQKLKEECKKTKSNHYSNSVVSKTKKEKNLKSEILSHENLNFPVTYFGQLKLLLSTSLLQMFRNKKLLFTQLINHILIGLVTGSLFLNSNKNASTAKENLFFYFTVVMFFIYTHTMTSVLLFPSEVEVFKREYCNRWYSLSAYYSSLMLKNIPIMVSCGFVFNLLTYMMSGQILNLYYFLLFCMVTFAISIASEALGTFVGTVFNILHGSVVSASILAPLIMFALYGIGHGENINPFMNIAISISFVRSGFVALGNLMLANQPPLECSEIFCYYQNTDHLLSDMGMKNKLFYLETFYILIFAFVFRILGFMALRIRTRYDTEKRIEAFVFSFVKGKD